MYVKRLRIANVLGFSGPRNVDLNFERPDGSYAGITVLAGRNGSGKTSLLRCIALLLAGPQASASLVPELRSWRATPGKCGVRLDYQFDKLELRKLAEEEGAAVDPQFGRGSLRLDFPAFGKSRRRSYITWTEAIPVSVSDVDEEQPDEELGEGLTESRAVDESNDGESRRFAVGYGPFRRLSYSPHESRIARTEDVELIRRFVTLFHEEASLGESVSWLTSLHLRNLEGREGAGELLSTVLEFLADGLLPDGYAIRRVDSDGLWVLKDGEEFPLTEMSDGYRAVAALVLDVMRSLYDFYGNLPVGRASNSLGVDLPGVVLVDELDAHLHVSWQKKIGGWLRSHFPQIQFIVTTHSPFVCQSADPGGLIRLAGPDEQAPPRVVSDDLYQRIVYGSGDDAALSELFGLESPYSERADQVRRELVELERRVLSGAASKGEIVEYGRLSEKLSSSAAARVDEIAARLGDEA